MDFWQTLRISPEMTLEDLVERREIAKVDFKDISKFKWDQLVYGPPSACDHRNNRKGASASTYERSLNQNEETIGLTQSPLRAHSNTWVELFGKTPLFFRYSGVNAANAANLLAKRR